MSTDETKASVPVKPDMASTFGDFAAAYEKMVGGLSRDIATWAIGFLPPITSTSTVHDNACGPGAVTEAIMFKEKNAADPPKILATDIAPPMVQIVAGKAKAKGWDKVEAKVLDMLDLKGVEDKSLTHSMTNLGVFSAVDLAVMAKEVHRTLKSGGVAAITHWKHAGTMKLVRRVQEHIRPDIPMLMDNAANDDNGPDAPPPLPADATEEERVARNSEHWQSVLKKVFGEANVSRELNETFWPADEDMLVETFTSSFWDSMAKQGYTDEDKAKWTPELVRSCILEEEKQSKRIRMDIWCYFCRKD